jgi:phosphoribosylformimino-5-aminoimidazole carboxamide ribotide isomerase
VSPPIELYPAIDVREGRAVRLVQGDYDRETSYDADPLDAARRWVAGGARFLHVVDLDGAREGGQPNLDVARRIAEGAGVPVQLGGGIRDADAVERVLDAGIERAVIGTRAQREPGFVGGLAKRHGERIVASVDARAGDVAVEGWERGTGTRAVELIAELASLGVTNIVFTPVEVDGTLAGPGLEQLAEAGAAAAAGGSGLIYSGGVGTIEHLETLAGLRLPALAGVIVGRALYEGRFEVAEAMSALGGDG